MFKQESSDSQNQDLFFEGLEIGAVSLKWIRRARNQETITKIEPHNGNPRKSVQKLIDSHKSNGKSRIAVTGQSAGVLLDLPYRSETECVEKALAYHNLKPDLLLSLGGENFIIYPLKKRAGKKHCRNFQMRRRYR